MKQILIVVAAMCASVAGQAVAEEAAPAAAAAHYTTNTTTLGELLDNSATRTVVENHLPGISTHPQLDLARGLTLKALQAYSAEITDEKLAAIDADLASVH